MVMAKAKDKVPDSARTFCRFADEIVDKWTAPGIQSETLARLPPSTFPQCSTGFPVLFLYPPFSSVPHLLFCLKARTLPLHCLVWLLAASSRHLSGRPERSEHPTT